MAFEQRLIEQIVHVQIQRPFAEVRHIQPLSLDCNHAEHVVPLLIGPLAAQPVPAQVAEYYVFRSRHGKFNGRCAECFELLEASPPELDLLIWIRSQRENIEFVAAWKVYHIERPARVDIEVSPQLVHKRFDVLGTNAGNQVDISRGSPETMNRT